MIKVYEIKGKQAAQLVFTYFGVSLKLMFEGGNLSRNAGATYTTNERFIQDAIENDYRFGKTIFVVSSYRTAEDDAQEAAAKAAQAEQPAPAKTSSRNSSRSGKSSTKAAEPAPAESKAEEKPAEPQGPVAITECNDVNEVLAWFAMKGEVATSQEELRALADKYGVTFPNVEL